MSGLLVKSVAVMKDNLEELNAAGVDVPVLLGGAALTRDYAVNDLATLYKGKLFYCKDAFAGLNMMDAIVGDGGAGGVRHAAEGGGPAAGAAGDQGVRRPGRGTLPARADVKTDNPVPLPPFWGRRQVTGIPAEQLFAYINPNALFLGQWDFKKKGLRTRRTKSCWTRRPGRCSPNYRSGPWSRNCSTPRSSMVTSPCRATATT